MLRRTSPSKEASILSLEKSVHTVQTMLKTASTSCNTLRFQEAAIPASEVLVRSFCPERYLILRCGSAPSILPKIY